MKDIPKNSYEPILHEAAEILSQLIQVQTVTGKGRETEAAQILLREAKNLGLVCRIEAPQAGRGSFIAKISGAQEESLLLLSHLDVAPVTSPKAWRYPPFSGAIAENAIWGRGAIDCKGLVVVWLMVLCLLHRLAIPLRRSVVMVAAADEESGGRWGMEWLVKNAKELQTCRWGLNEGGGFPLQLRGKKFITCQTGEKGDAHLRFQDLQGLVAQQQFTLNAPVTSSTRRMLEVLTPDWFPDFLVGTKKALPLWRLWLKHLQRSAPYRIDVHELLNHTVSLQSTKDAVEFHIRSIPGSEIREVVSMALQSIGLSPNRATELTFIDGAESPIDMELYRCIEGVVERFLPEVRLLPHITPGYSDSRFLRRGGIPVYGFFPLPFGTPITSQHATDECLSLRGLGQAIEMLFEIVHQFCT